jgi:uncharacterized protein (DUF885 family)
MTGEEIHRMGLAQVAELHGQLDPLLRAAGYAQGSVGERMNALNPNFAISADSTIFGGRSADRLALLSYVDHQAFPFSLVCQRCRTLFTQRLLGWHR